jgi:hypothetical protein
MGSSQLEEAPEIAIRTIPSGQQRPSPIPCAEPCGERPLHRDRCFHVVMNLSHPPAW